MPAGGTHQHPKPMVPVNRPVGQNDIGMIAWVLTLRTPECPQGRKVGICFLVQLDLNIPEGACMFACKINQSTS